MTIKRLRTIYYPAKDVGALIKFYEGALGLSLKFRDGDDWAEFRTGDASFAFGSPAETSPEANGPVAVFESDELETLVDEIVAQGGSLIGRRDMGDHGDLLTCRDPQGNVFQVLSKRPIAQKA